MYNKYLLNILLWFIPAEIVWLVLHLLFTIQILNNCFAMLLFILYSFLCRGSFALCSRTQHLQSDIWCTWRQLHELLIVLSWTISAPLGTPVFPFLKGLNKSSTYLTGLCWDWVIFESFWYLLLSFFSLESINNVDFHYQHWRMLISLSIDYYF